MSVELPICLTIAGLDPSGGAGVLADIKTFQAFGCYGAAAITSLTFQNTQGVYGAENVDAETLRKQIDPVFDDLEVVAVKTGMLPTREAIETVADIIRERKPRFFVVDPVVRSTSGFDLIDGGALAGLVEKLFPLATVVTPNLPEAERITGIRIDSPDKVAAAASQILDLGASAVLLKGGHSSDANATDVLYTAEGVEIFTAERIDSTSTHGTGCTLAAGIAANLAKGSTLSEAIAAAKEFVTEAIRQAPQIGHGHGPLNHLIRNK